MDELVCIENCVVNRIIFASERKDFVVVRAETGTEAFTAILDRPCMEGERLRLFGRWVIHKKYGRQFKADLAERPKDLSLDEIEIFLQNIKHIGPVRAEKIVRMFGSDTMNVIENNPDKLRLAGIPEQAIEAVKQEVTNNKIFRDVKMRLLPLGLSLTTIKKIFDTYGVKCIEVVTTNPYRLADDIRGIGFLKADEIAEAVGIPFDSDFRIQAGIKYVLSQEEQNGHVYYPYGSLLKEAMEVLSKDGRQLELEKIIQNVPNTNEVIIEDDRVYSKRLYEQEKYIAYKLVELANKQLRPVKDVDKILQKLQKENGIIYAEKQVQAVRKSLANNVSVITGGPGTGKTTVIKAIINVLKENDMTFALAAPTGKATKRMSEATGEEAMTVHRLLEATFDRETKTSYFARNEDNPIDADVVIIDESSMLDNSLTYHLLKAIKNRIIFVGDVDQLPSVGAGNVLKDMILSGMIPVTKLEVVFRQKDTSSIITNAHLINSGRMPVFNSDDFKFTEAETADEIINEYLNLLKSGLSIFDVQILSPMYNGPLGVRELNRRVQELVNPPKPGKKELTFGSTIFRVGDKVMQTANNYELDIFNGDTGIIRDITEDDGTISVMVQFDDKLVKISGEDIQDLILAYAITVHKSQGSEYHTVLMALSTGHYIMLKRNLIYTGVTRAKKNVHIFGSKKSIGIAVRTVDASKRYTWLKERLQERVFAEMMLQRNVSGQA